MENQNKNFQKKKWKGGRHRVLGILLAAAVAFNRMPFGSVAVSASEKTESGLCEICSSEILEDGSSETPEEDRKDNNSETGTSEPENADETQEPDSVQAETEEETESVDETQEPDSVQAETEEETESVGETQEPDNVQAETEEGTESVDETQEPDNERTEIEERANGTAALGGLDFGSDADTSRGNLDTDGYHWEAGAGSYTLTLKNATISGTVVLPDATVAIVTEGSCSINKLEICKDPDNTKLTFSGNGKLSVNEAISLYGGDNNTITIAEGAEVAANGGIGIGASGGVNSIVTVYGKLTANGGENNAIYAGQVIVGSGGTLNVSGTMGVALNGMSNGCEDAFTVEKGGCFTANCAEFNMRVYTGSSVDNAVNVPQDHMPDDCEVKQYSGVIMLVHKGTDNEYTGAITIHEKHIWSDWKHDKTGHWEECTVEGCGKKNNYGKHNFNQDTQQCVCGAGLAVALCGTEGLVYDGQAKMPVVIVTVDNQTLDAENYDTVYSKNIDAGEAAVTITGKNDLNFEQTKTFEIGKATPVIVWHAAAQELGYTGSEAAITKPDVILANSETYGGTIRYSYAAQGSDEWKDGLPVDTGTYTVKASIAEQDNYTASESTDNMTLTINCSHINTELRNEKKATCTEEGYSGDTYCKDCGTLVKNGEKTGFAAHSGGKQTCISGKICEVCGKEYTEKDENVHEHTELRNEKKATCTEEGYSGDTCCKDCNTKIESGNVIPALGHDWQITSKNGKQRIYTCSRCGATRKETVRKPSKSEDKHSHSYTRSVLENATCTKAGAYLYTCDCGDTYTQGIPMLKHNYTYQVTIEPTIFAEGEITYTCSRCGHQYTERIPMLIPGDDFKETQEPTVSAEEVQPYIRSQYNDTYPKPIDKLEDDLSRADTDAQSSVDVIREEPDYAEEQSIVADADASVVSPTKPIEPIETDAADNPLQTGNQFPWWILLIAVLVMITGFYMARRQRNKKEQRDD